MQAQKEDIVKGKQVGIFYVSRRPGQDRWPVGVGSTRVYVRVEIAKSGDLQEALYETRPRRGEDVMNIGYV